MKKIFFFAALFFSFAGIKVNAQSAPGGNANGGFQISPLRYDWVTNLGDEKQGSVYVKNNSDKPIEVDTDVQDFVISPDLRTDANFFVPSENNPLKAYDVINWINIDKSPFQLTPGESKEVPFTVNIPSKTPTGGYYGVIFFTEKPLITNNTNAAAKVDVQYRLGTLVTFAMHGDGPITEKGNLNLFESAKSIFIDNPVQLNVQASNTGNLPYKVSGTVDVSRYGKHVLSLDIAPKMLYPDRTRIIDGLSWNFSMFDIGKYTAKLDLKSEDGSVVMNKVISFWIIPWKLIGLIILVILVIFAIFYIGEMDGEKIEKNKLKKNSARKNAKKNNKK